MDLHARSGDAFLEVLRLGPGGGEVLLGAAGQQKPAAHSLGRLGDDELPDVVRERAREPGEDLVGAVAVALEGHPIGVHEHAATHGEARRSARPESALPVLVERNAEVLRGRGEEGAMSGRALIGDVEAADVIAAQLDHLDVGAADVDDDVRAGARRAGGLRVGDRLDEGGVGAERGTDEIGAVAGHPDRADLERHARLGGDALQIGEAAAHVLDRVRGRGSVALREQLAGSADEHRLGARRSGVDAEMHARSFSRASERDASRRRRAAKRLDARAIFGGLDEASTLSSAPDHPADARERSAGAGRVEPRADGGEELGVRGHFDRAGLDPPVAPEIGERLAPRIREERQVGVRSAEQQDRRTKDASAREHREVLNDDRARERGERGATARAALDEVDDVVLREHPALGGDREVTDRLARADVLGGQPEPMHHAIDRRAGSRRAAVVHLHVFIARPIAEDHELGVLSSELDDGARLGDARARRRDDRLHLVDRDRV